MTTRTDPRALTRELLAFNTINPPGMERACARFLGAKLERAGFRTTYHEFAASRTSLIAEIGGDAKRPPICFTGHIDTVLAHTEIENGGEQWRHAPWTHIKVDRGRRGQRQKHDCGYGKFYRRHNSPYERERPRDLRPLIEVTRT